MDLRNKKLMRHSFTKISSRVCQKDQLICTSTVNQESASGKNKVSFQTIKFSNVGQGPPLNHLDEALIPSSAFYAGTK